LGGGGGGAVCAELGLVLEVAAEGPGEVGQGDSPSLGLVVAVWGGGHGPIRSVGASAGPVDFNPWDQPARARLTRRTISPAMATLLAGPQGSTSPPVVTKRTAEASAPN